MLRTHTCNELRSSDIGEKVVLAGWFENIRKVSKNLGFLVPYRFLVFVNWMASEKLKNYIFLRTQIKRR